MCVFSASLECNEKGNKDWRFWKDEYCNNMTDALRHRTIHIQPLRHKHHLEHKEE